MCLVMTFISSLPSFSFVRWILPCSMQVHHTSYPGHPSIASTQDTGQVNWVCLLNLLGNSSALGFRNIFQKGLSCYCLIPRTWKHLRTIHLAYPQERRLHTSHLYCSILSWSDQAAYFWDRVYFHQMYSPGCQCDVCLCDTELSPLNIEWKPATFHTNTQQS